MTATIETGKVGLKPGPNGGNGSHPNIERDHMVVGSPAMRAIFDLLDRVAASAATVLINGESGTGKELVARQIHRRSGRTGRFVSLNCAAIPHDLLESILFGHSRGSFTGAIRDELGLMRLAQDGTFFLDEIGTMPILTQVKMLRVLQEREVLAVGAHDPVSINCRIITATNANLERLVVAGTFRADLLYRINVIDLNLPPLRERVEEIPLLVEHFFKCWPSQPLPLSDRVMAFFHHYSWPGNIRQLENALERAMALDQDGLIDLDDLPRQMVAPPNRPQPQPEFVPQLLHVLVQDHILQTMEHAKQNQTWAAELLGISRQSLRQRLKQYGILPVRRHRLQP